MDLIQDSNLLNPPILSSTLKEFPKKLAKEKITSSLISYNGEVVFEYFKNWKMKEKDHKVNSISKSVLSTLIGIAIDQKIIQIHEPISTYFPNLDEQRGKITIEHLLTMTPGLDWPEFTTWGGRPFPMIDSKDWVKFILARDLVEAAGQSMHYNSGCSHLLSAILQIASGESVIDFAKKHLFSPLDIETFKWYKDSKGIVIGGFGLTLKTEDMLKIGQLYLQNGVWNGKRIVSEKWIQESTKPHFHTYGQIGSYGYHWWVLMNAEQKPMEPYVYFAMGYGGQFIIIVPKYKLITVFTSNLYDNTFLPLHLFKNEILKYLT